MTSKKKILFVTTNTAELADGSQTGVWLEEFAVPYIIFVDTGYEVTIASQKGTVSRLDDDSLSCSNPMEWDAPGKLLEKTEKLENINLKEYDAIFFPGGHGPMFDIAEDETVKKAVEYFYNNGKIVSAVCHGPAGLILAKDLNGNHIVDGKRLTSFTNKEEHIMKKVELIPFLLEDKLKELGADFIEKAPWSEHVEVDKNLITGQNPASAIAVAEQVIKALGEG